ncbi:MAG: FAD-dependent oxidoreductase, partial [Myxococcales bacterium]|nr:FAD-dependent oxidoreductase [Myxococcales bacterium]
MYEMLFTPAKIGRMWLKNRIVRAPNTTLYASPKDGTVTQLLLDHYAVEAAGGCGLCMVEASSVDVNSRLQYGEPTLDSDYALGGLWNLAEVIKMNGAKAGIQLIHAGRQCLVQEKTPVAPSPRQDGYFRVQPRALTVEEIERIITPFADAVDRAMRAGFDCIEYHGAHGYLPAEFLSREANHRTDDWGGSLENRARFSLEIVRRTREKVGSDFPLIYRFSAEDYVEDGVTLEESIQFAKWLEEAGVDALDVSAGTGEVWEHTVAPTHFPYGNLVHLAEAVKKEVTIPVIAVGAINEPAQAEAILASGKADFVALCRAITADPDWPKKAAAGRADEIRPCIRCNDCLDTILPGTPMRCRVNFLEGRESMYQLKRARERKKVVVAGGGAAGMEAARTAFYRGHDVTLVEKGETLGGLLIPACVIPTKEDLNKLFQWYVREMERLPIRVLTETEATPELVAELGADALIVATGHGDTAAKPRGLAGLDHPHVVTAMDLLAERAPVRDSLVIGGGFMGCDIAQHIAGTGARVTLLTRYDREHVGGTVGFFTRNSLFELLDRMSVTIRAGIAYREVTDEGVLITNED